MTLAFCAEALSSCSKDSEAKMKTVFFLLMLLMEISYIFVNGKFKVHKGNNPGLCSKKNSREMILVRDRENKYKLLICTNDNGIYGWRTLDGSSPPGEFFSPGYDCTSILNKDPKAKDGFYWITLGYKMPRKVYCDMTTDGGGFFLVGHKNTSITWTVPSNNKPVEPFGDPHWSSSLGNARIIDFRIQIASAENFKTTKAHWYYRLRNPRALKHLMIINKGGCGKSSPGIGDVKFVKDLMTDNIVTTQFRCSKFGVAHSQRAKFGWAKMNDCLERPCRWGFAFHHKYPIQTDFSGAFSYSTKNAISGIDFGSTAFIGCDNGKCCGCYGPKNGKNNYCFKECSSQNGGTIKKDVYTWFWVRSSLPKRMWSKCMEYKVTENGAPVWYKLVGANVLPKKGRCGKDKPLFYDGMLVVPDNKTAKEIPKIEGIMVYRKDNKKIYVQSDKKLHALAEENKMPTPNWKQCTWKANDGRDNGLIRTCTFVKKRSDTYLRVFYEGNLRIYNCNSCCKRWYFTFGGAECNVPIEGIYYMWRGVNHKNLHRHRHIEGYCGNIRKGNIRVGFNVGNCKGYGNADAYSGWNSVSRIVIEEVPPSQ